MRKAFLILILLPLLILSCIKENYINEENITPQYDQSIKKDSASSQSILANKEGDGEDDDDDEYNCCSFTYGQWSNCSEGYQVRSWASRSNTCIPPLDSIQRTCESAIVQYFYYNPTYTGIRVVCNRPGMIHIYNQSGQIVSILNYNTGGNWVIVGFIPAGIYTAKTYSRVVTFTR